MYVHVDASDALDELDRLIDGPSAKDNMKFDSVLAAQFVQTTADVHVDTYSLKLSGKMDSEHGKTQWSGEIVYGGISTGINNPVDYAEYEYRRGGTHDFIRSAKMMDGDYLDAVLDYLRG